MTEEEEFEPAIQIANKYIAEINAIKADPSKLEQFAKDHQAVQETKEVKSKPRSKPEPIEEEEDINEQIESLKPTFDKKAKDDVDYMETNTDQSPPALLEAFEDAKVPSTTPFKFIAKRYFNGIKNITDVTERAQFLQECLAKGKLKPDKQQMILVTFFGQDLEDLAVYIEGLEDNSTSSAPLKTVNGEPILAAKEYSKLIEVEATLPNGEPEYLPDGSIRMKKVPYGVWISEERKKASHEAKVDKMLERQALSGGGTNQLAIAMMNTQSGMAKSIAEASDRAHQAEMARIADRIPREPFGEIKHFKETAAALGVDPFNNRKDQTSEIKAIGDVARDLSAAVGDNIVNKADSSNLGRTVVDLATKFIQKQMDKEEKELELKQMEFKLAHPTLVGQHIEDAMVGKEDVTNFLKNVPKAMAAKYQAEHPKVLPKVN